MKDTMIKYRCNKEFCYTKAVLCMLFVLLFLSSTSYSQTYALPDTNFRNKLLSSYPSVMTGNLLNIPAAGALTGSLTLNNAGILNADGIQYFTKINTLDLSFNKLITIPDISGLTQLTYLYLIHNQLVSAPSISTLTNLIEFQVQDNQLTSLPSFAANLNLISLYCQNNKLTSIPDISMLVNLQILDVGNNNIVQLPDLSPLVNLQQLHVHQMGIDTIIGVSALTKLNILYAWGNHIRDLSGLDANTTLQIFQVFDNDLKSLPDLSNKPSLNSISFINNFLSFEDILSLTALSNFSIFVYSPQKPIPFSSYIVRVKDSLKLDAGIDKGVSNDQYAWYKNGIALATNNSGIYSISSVVYSDSGSYYVIVTNPGLPGLTLQTAAGIVAVKPCLEINSFDTKVLSESCTDGVEIQLSAINLGGGTAPFSYRIVPSDKKDTLYSISSTPQFQSLSPGLYTVVVKDSRMCEAIQNISIKPFRGCDPVFSPNGDGIVDTYYIDDSGRVKIYDIGRNLIKELNAPAVWDGTKSDGSFADDGYYAIVINGTKIIHITLIK